MNRLRMKPGGRSLVPVELPCGDMKVLNLGLRGLLALDAEGNAPVKIVKCDQGHKSRVTHEREGDRYWLVGEAI